jgi:hypothetical protein
MLANGQENLKAGRHRLPRFGARLSWRLSEKKESCTLSYLEAVNAQMVWRRALGSNAEEVNEAMGQGSGCRMPSPIPISKKKMKAGKMARKFGCTLSPMASVRK